MPQNYAFAHDRFFDHSVNEIRKIIRFTAIRTKLVDKYWYADTATTALPHWLDNTTDGSTWFWWLGMSRKTGGMTDAVITKHHN